MSYWIASNKSPVQQRSVSIPAESGTDYIAGQEIRIRIDPSLKYFDPSRTFLEFFTKVVPPTYSADGTDNLPCPTKLQLDTEIGGQVLCRSIRIHDNNGTLLEEIDNYNTMVAMKYDYHTNDSLRGKRALCEGSSYYNSDYRGTRGSTKSYANNVDENTYFRVSTADPINASWTSADFVNAKCCLPLHTGILGSDRVFPNHLLGGITITILLEDNNRVFRQVDSAMRFRRLTLNPMFNQANSYAGGTVPNASVKTNGSFVAFDFKQENSVAGVPSTCPFVVGEKLGFQRQVTGNASVIAFTGNKPVIKEITMNGDYVKVELNASVTVNGKGMENTEDIFVFSDSVADATTYDPTYTVTDVNLICQEVIPTPADESKMMNMLKEGGTLNYDFLSATTYKYSQLSSDRVANIRLPLNNSRAKSIICVPTDANVYTSKENINASLTYKVCQLENMNASNFYLRSNRSGLIGISDNVTDYQWLYDGRLQPNRRVSLTKVSSDTSIDAQHLLELDKALSQAGITAHSYQSFNQNFIIGRALALGDAVYDARNKDFSLQINYNQTTAPSKNKLWISYVFHLRRIQIQNGNINVIV
jgi:hypothetical protein